MCTHHIEFMKVLELTHFSHKPNEETRKLQITGGSTYVISLPKRWVTQNGLEKGSSLLVRQEENGTLAVLPPDMGKTEKIEEAIIKVSPEEGSDTLIRKTVAVYLLGYNIIHIRAKDQKEILSTQRNAIKTFARNMLVGTEIVTDTSKDLTLQVLLSYPELSVPSALRRMSIITASMHKDAITALKNIDYQLAKDVRATDYEVNRFHLYIIRQLKMAIQNPRIITEIGLKKPKDCLGYRLITKMVERTADHATNIAKKVLLLKKCLDEEFLQTIQEMNNVAISSFETSIESLFRRDYELADSVIAKANKIISLEKKALVSSKETNIEEASNIRLVIESVRRIAEYSTDIAEVVLNMTVESVIR
ncbi:MAG: type I-B CRISPR-associated protein Cas8b1/Cst1 [Candidatus Bathyarchaeum sp.]|nr:MAG: type I-B CRISPR-associated protein Cas8b1/Cst1 [Candidatus Bathyarchaeum sp.]